MNINDVAWEIPLPPEIGSLTAKFDWHRVSTGESGAATFRLEEGDKPVYFLKVGSSVRDQRWLWHEIERLRWLHGKIAVPEVVTAAEHEARVFLLMTTVPGSDATAMIGRFSSERIVRLLANGMRQWHRTSVIGCPFDHSAATETERAAYALEHGFVDESDFDHERLGRTAADIHEELVATIPSVSDPVLTHGDYTLPNVMIASGEISGFVDVGRSGVSDRYKDLAICVRSIERNLGADFVPLLFQEYGIAEPDQDRLHFYRLLDEFG